MKKTLLLCFIHGFKGSDETTFGGFPEHLRALVGQALPKIEVKAIIYPKYETRGDLTDCVSRFRDWLLEKVIDIEVAAHTPSPTIDPSVRTILIGHSMGGIVAADTLLALALDRPIDSTTSTDPSSSTAPTSITSITELTTSMFPSIQGVLAFDTPYLGISPGVVAHGAETHYNSASDAFSQLSTLSGMLWGKSATSDTGNSAPKKSVAALPAPENSSAATTTWHRWGKMAMYAGAAGAVAAGGAAAYMKREQLTQGWTWATSHLEFIGCLMRGEELKRRMAGVLRVNEELHVGFANLYTKLGKGAQQIQRSGNTGAGGSSIAGAVMGSQVRTFCNLPKREGSLGFWHEAVNDAAWDETGAHMTMFFPKDNPGYYTMSEQAKSYIVKWTMNEWYESSTGDHVVLQIGE